MLQTLQWLQVPGVSTTPSMLFSALSQMNLFAVSCSQISPNISYHTYQALHLDVLLFWAKSWKMEIDVTQYLATRAFKHFISFGLPNSQVGQWHRPYCSYSRLSNQKRRRLTGLFQDAQLVRGRARVRTKAFWHSVQDSFNTLNAESRVKPCGSVTCKVLSIVIHPFTTGPCRGSQSP